MLHTAPLAPMGRTYAFNSEAVISILGWDNLKDNQIPQDQIREIIYELNRDTSIEQDIINEIQGILIADNIPVHETKLKIVFAEGSLIALSTVIISILGAFAGSVLHDATKKVFADPIADIIKAVLKKIIPRKVTEVIKKIKSSAEVFIVSIKVNYPSSKENINNNIQPISIRILIGINILILLLVLICLIILLSLILPSISIK